MILNGILCRVEEATHVSPKPVDINRDNGIERSKAWMPTLRKLNKTTAK